jgi:Retrotransposon gag protein
MMMDAETDKPARLETLKDEFTQLKAQIATIMTQQAQILQRLGGTTISTPTPPTITRTSNSKLKPAPPNDFDRTWCKGHAFLTSCDLYVNLVPHQFADNEKPILWAISYMKTSRAALFAQRVVWHQVKYNMPKFVTWEEFWTAFITEFCLKNKTVLALAKLETEKYYQGKRSVDEYVDDFKELIEQARYDQGCPVVVKFRWGLDKDIQDTITNIPVGWLRHSGRYLYRYSHTLLFNYCTEFLTNNYIKIRYWKLCIGSKCWKLKNNINMSFVLDESWIYIVFMFWSDPLNK